MEAIKERKKCTKCDKGELDTRIPRSFTVKFFLFWLPIKKYRCSLCWHTSYVYGSVWRKKGKTDLSEQLV